MNGAWAVVAVMTALLLMAAAAVGVFVYYTADEDPAHDGLDMERASFQPVAAEEAGAPGLRSPGSNETVAQLQRRVTSLETEVLILAAQLEESRNRMKPLLALLEAAKASGSVHFAPDGTPVIPESIEIEDFGSVGVELAASFAKKMELTPERSAAFQKQYAETLAQVKALEQEHATVSVEGDSTTIRIGRFGSDGDQLQRSWSDWILSYLTDDQAASYKKQGGVNALFGGRMGQYERTIEIKEAGGNVSMSETSVSTGGEEYRTETTGPAEARDFVLEDYLHLLK